MQQAVLLFRQMLSLWMMISDDVFPVSWQKYRV